MRGQVNYVSSMMVSNAEQPISTTALDTIINKFRRGAKAEGSKRHDVPRGPNAIASFSVTIERYRVSYEFRNGREALGTRDGREALGTRDGPITCSVIHSFYSFLGFGHSCCYYCMGL